ncbi:hypothetical protein ADL12_36120 [Streptomyces regalis]|uniref:Uncharacterized protein n=1 Tax=Streptomyces regalis TaxID=68262 RepID=A0A101JDE4_9ACTN|nr:hypothetical protein [Streptomyces regalis]KUL24764.1 hypothetical protein ADL12_36120 [Streptomyces regalis]
MRRPEQTGGDFVPGTAVDVVPASAFGVAGCGVDVADQEGIARSAVDLVIAETALDGVVPTQSADPVVATPAVDGGVVVGGAVVEDEVTGLDRDALDLDVCRGVAWYASAALPGYAEDLRSLTTALRAGRARHRRRGSSPSSNACTSSRLRSLRSPDEHCPGART